jgi:hypothetical protein
MLFNKVKTANSWFTIINTFAGLMMMPFMIPDALTQDTFYFKFKFIRYLFPYFDLSALLMSKENIAPGMIINPQSYTVHFCFLFYLFFFILLQSKIIQKLVKRQ